MALSWDSDQCWYLERVEARGGHTAPCSELGVESGRCWTDSVPSL